MTKEQKEYLEIIFDEIVDFVEIETCDFNFKMLKSLDFNYRFIYVDNQFLCEIYNSYIFSESFTYIEIKTMLCLILKHQTLSREKKFNDYLQEIECIKNKIKDVDCSYRDYITSEYNTEIKKKKDVCIIEKYTLNQEILRLQKENRALKKIKWYHIFIKK